jgi:hypothetical protein
MSHQKTLLLKGQRWLFLPRKSMLVKTKNKTKPKRKRGGVGGGWGAPGGESTPEK